MFQTRTNTLKLGWRKANTNERINCPRCDFENEDLEHFLVHCQPLKKNRNRVRVLRNPQQEDIEITLQKYLLFDKEQNTDEIIEESKRTLTILMWMKGKEHLIAEQQQQNQ